MSDSADAQPDPAQVLVAWMPVIRQIATALARRHALAGADRDEFVSWAAARMVGDEYAVVRKFGGRSSLPTYLAVVVRNLFHDWRNEVWGRWRPSAEAHRLGPLAVRLEELHVRDGRPLQESVAALCAHDPALDTRELTRLAGQLPRRVRPRETSLDDASTVLADEHGAADAAERADNDRVKQVVRELVAELPPEDAVILLLHYWSGLSVADIARRLSLEQKPLYPRLKALQARLRRALEARGMTRAVLVDALGPEVAW